MKNRRIAVLGAGAIGASVAADIVSAGIPVIAIDQWPAHVEAVKKNGLQVSTAGDVKTVMVEALHQCDLASQCEPFDIVFLGVKAYDTRWAAELIRPHLKDSGVIVGLQNGLCDDDIARIAGNHRTIGTVVELSAEIFVPGVVERHTPASKTWFGVGTANPQLKTRVTEIAQLLGTGARVTEIEDIAAAKWTKLIANAIILGPGGLAGTTIAEAFALPGMRELAAAIGREAVAVSIAEGFPVRPVFGLKDDDMEGGPEAVARILVDTILSHVGPNARTAVLHDHIKRRYSEVDCINGLIVAAGAKHGIPTPANARVVQLTQEIWTGVSSPGRDNVTRAFTAH